MTGPDTFDLAALTSELTLDEGFRTLPYTDTRGYVSIGIGRNLSTCGLSAAEVGYLFANDVARCCAALDGHLSWWRGLPPVQQRVMINLVFNMGWHGLAQFTRFLAAMQAHDWQDASVELMHSQWWRQVGQRGPRILGRLLAHDDTPTA